MTATKKKPAKRTATKKKAVTFISRFPDFKLNRLHPEYVYDGRGKILGTDIEEDGSDPDVVFEDTVFTTDDPVLIDFVRDHEEFERNIWEQGAAPDEPEPRFADQMDKIVAATAVRDVDALNEVINEEESTHNRPQIVQAAESAIERIEEVPTELGGIDDQTVVPAAGALNEPEPTED